MTNNDNFIQLMKRVCGDESWSTFSEKSGIAAPTLYRIASGNIKRPIKLSLATKIAEASIDKTITADLLINASREHINDGSSLHGIRFQKKEQQALEDAQKIIQHHLLQEGNSIRINDGNSFDIPYDFSLIIDNGTEEIINYYEVKYDPNSINVLPDIYLEIGKIVTSKLKKNQHYNIIFITENSKPVLSDNHFKSSYSVPLTIYIIHNKELSTIINLEDIN